MDMGELQPQQIRPHNLINNSNKLSNSNDINTAYDTGYNLNAAYGRDGINKIDNIGEEHEQYLYLIQQEKNEDYIENKDNNNNTAYKTVTLHGLHYWDDGFIQQLRPTNNNSGIVQYNNNELCIHAVGSACRILGEANGVPTTVIVDTGSAVSILGYRLVEEARITELKPWAGPRLRAANGIGMNVRGATRMSLKLGERTYEQDFAVVEGFPHEVLVGEDFLRTYGVDIKYSEGIVEIQGDRHLQCMNIIEENTGRMCSDMREVGVRGKHREDVLITMREVGVR